MGAKEWIGMVHTYKFINNSQITITVSVQEIQVGSQPHQEKVILPGFDWVVNMDSEETFVSATFEYFKISEDGSPPERKVNKIFNDFLKMKAGGTLTFGPPHRQRYFTGMRRHLFTLQGE